MPINSPASAVEAFFAPPYMLLAKATATSALLVASSGAYIVDLIALILEKKASGVDLKK